MAIRKASLTDSIYVIEWFAHCRKNRLCKFNTPCKKDEPGRLSRLNAYCSYRAKQFNRSFARLNHPAKLVSMLWAKLVFACITHYKSINNNYIWVITFFFCLVILTFCFDDFRNIESLNNVIFQYLRTGRSSGLRLNRSLCYLAWFETYCRTNAVLKKTWVP